MSAFCPVGLFLGAVPYGASPLVLVGFLLGRCPRRGQGCPKAWFWGFPNLHCVAGRAIPLP